MKNNTSGPIKPIIGFKGLSPFQHPCERNRIWRTLHTPLKLQHVGVKSPSDVSRISLSCHQGQTGLIAKHFHIQNTPCSYIHYMLPVFPHLECVYVMITARAGKKICSGKAFAELPSGAELSLFTFLTEYLFKSSVHLPEDGICIQPSEAETYIESLFPMQFSHLLI